MRLNILRGGPRHYPYFLIYHTYHAHILEISLFQHILLYIEYNHLDMHDMICTQAQNF